MHGKQGTDENLFREVPESAGPRLATYRGGVAHVIRPPGAQSVVQAEHNLVSVMLAPTTGLRSAIGSDKLQGYEAVPGTLIITPAGMDSKVEWDRTRENATIILPTAVMQELAEDELDFGRFALDPVPLGTVDPWALHIAEALKLELTQRDNPNELFVESLVTIFGVHLLRRYAGSGGTLARVKGGLSIRQAQRVKQYLESHYSRKLSIAELASVTGLSRHYFIQAFSRTFGKPPHQYLIDLRLDVAEKLLVRSDLDIASIARCCGFSSQSHLTTAMSKHRKMTPMQVRQGR